MKKLYNSPDVEVINAITSEYCANGESIVDELGYVETTVSDSLLNEE